MDTGDSEDVRILHNQLKREDNAGRRDNIRRTISKINNRSGAVKSMREALVKEHRAGNKGNIKDIHDYIKGKAKYGQNERI